MSKKKKSNSRVLRQLAEDLIRQLAEEHDIREADWGDLVTSLVRQWITYDGTATLFLAGQQDYFVLNKTPLGKPCIVPGTALPGWMKAFTRDWNIRPEDLPEVFEQLNCGQSTR